jgi:hypothetical protein
MAMTGEIRQQLSQCSFGSYYWTFLLFLLYFLWMKIGQKGLREREMRPEFFLRSDENF